MRVTYRIVTVIVSPQRRRVLIDTCRLTCLSSNFSLTPTKPLLVIRHEDEVRSSTPPTCPRLGLSIGLVSYTFYYRELRRFFFDVVSVDTTKNASSYGGRGVIQQKKRRSMWRIWRKISGALLHHTITSTISTISMDLNVVTDTLCFLLCFYFPYCANSISASLSAFRSILICSVSCELILLNTDLQPAFPYSLLIVL